jgi:hypothetical protein
MKPDSGRGDARRDDARRDDIRHDSAQPGRAADKPRGGAVEREMKQLVMDLDERYRRNHDDTPAERQQKRGPLGGPGNFGGGDLDDSVGGKR